MSAPAPEVDAPEADAPEAATGQDRTPGRRPRLRQRLGQRLGRRMNAETAIVLFAIPVIVVVGFVAFAIWNATATKDSVVEGALAWAPGGVPSGGPPQHTIGPARAPRG